MTPGEEVERPARKLLADRRIKTRLALASVLALAVGAWLAPRAAQPTLTVPQEHAAPLLEEQVQLRDAGRAFDGVHDVAAQLRDHTVAIVTADEPAVGRTDFAEPRTGAPVMTGFGVFVSDTHVLTHSAGLDGRSSVVLSLGRDGRRADARVVAYDSRTELVLLETTPDAQPRVTFATAVPPAGALAVAVGRSEGRDIAVPVFVTSAGDDAFTIAGGDQSVLPGMPVFTLGGELFAVAAQDGRETRALAAEPAAARLLTQIATGERRSAFGLGFQAPAGAVADVFGDTGVVVTDVVEGGPADLAGIQAGDVILAVGEVVLDSDDTAARTFASSRVATPVSVRLRRATRTREVDVTPALAYEVASLARTRARAPDAPQARVLFPPDLLATTAIPPTATVLSVNGRTVSSRAQAQRELRRVRTPVPVLLQQDDRRFYVAIDPAS